MVDGVPDVSKATVILVVAVIEGVDAGGYLRLYVFIPRADAYRFVILRLEE